MLSSTFFENYYRCYNSENPAALRAFYHPQVELLSSQGLANGADAVIATYEQLIAMFEDRMTPENIIIDGDFAAVEITDSFTAKMDIEDFLGHALKQGDTLTLNLCAIYKVQNDKIVSASIYGR